MSRRIGPVRALVLGGFLVLAAAMSGRAQPPVGKDGKQDPDRPKVAFQSIDFVDMEGTYYRGKGRDTPCVLLVHKWGSNRAMGGWDELARGLQAAGFAVLTFDLRGHAGSQNVSPTFWALAANKNGILRSNPKQPTIDYKNFKPTYFPWVANDLLSARRFLETKNDAGEVNAGSLFIVGADEGAALGLEFMTSEWYRNYTLGFRALQSDGQKRIAGRDIAGAVWLSIPMRPAVSSVMPMRDWIRNTPGLRDENPMCFIYSERNRQAKTDAEELYRALTSGGPRDKHKHVLKEIKGQELGGQALLGPAAQSLGVQQMVIDFIKKTMAERRQIAWTDMEVSSNPLQIMDMRKLGVTIP